MNRTVTSITLVALSLIAEPADAQVQVSDFVQQHCIACHDDDTRSGGLSLQSKSVGDVVAASATWEHVVRRLKTRQMPPPDSGDRPTEAEYVAMLQELERQLDQRAKVNPQPGRTDTFRRLTRTEYANAIRDLLALNVDVAELLPKDEGSHGFDNITVGDLSPTLLNRYISAAQKISRLAVGASVDSPTAHIVRMRPDVTQEEHVPGLPIGTRGGLLIPFHFPLSGDYDIEVRLMRDRNEHLEGLTRPHDMEVLIDRVQVAEFTVRPPKNETEHQTADGHLKTRVAVTAGSREVGVTFVKMPSSLVETKRQPLDAHFNFHRHPRLSPAVYSVSITGPYGNTVVDETPARRRIFDLPDDISGSGTNREAAVLRQVMRRAWRRPVTDEDLQRPLQFFHDAAAEASRRSSSTPSSIFDAGIEAALTSILVNPNFLFRIQRDPADVAAETAYRISDVDLASRLSFFLWSSIPDDELLELAEQQELSKPGVLQQQVQRMLNDERSHALVDNFAGQWLYLKNLDSITPEARLFPDFDHNLREAFRTETELLFADVIRKDLSVLKLLKSDYTFLNERLAKHYGIPHVHGSRFRKVDLPADSQRGGILRHGSILTVTSYATRTSPVIRGHWILKNLLGSPPPPPPDNVPALKDNTVASNLSVRDRLAEHRANPACASCHNLMDPVGFALENFDAVGRWRDTEAGDPVDVSGGLPDGRKFSGVDGLEDGLLARPELFAGTLTEKLLTFALGRGLTHEDAPAVRQIVRQAAEQDYRFSSLITGIVHSVPFQMRMAE
ncbi:MAG: DUF1592 domain-containing protein [Planctomycetaceae bacterium]